MNVADITITSLETISVFNVTTGSYRFTLDELQNCTLSQEQETVDITGKQGRKLAKLKRNKTVTVSGTNGMVSGGLLEVQTGCEFENKATEVMWCDYLTTSNDVAETNYKAIGTEGAEIEGLYLKNTDGTLGDTMEQSDTATESTFTYDPDTKTLTFSGVADGTEVVVYYKRKIFAEVLENDSDTYSQTAMVYIDAIGEDKCANLFRIQIFIPKADFDGNFSFDMGDNQTVHNFDIEALAGACGLGANLWTYTIFGINTEDYEGDDTDDGGNGDTGDTGDTGGNTEPDDENP